MVFTSVRFGDIKAYFVKWCLHFKEDNRNGSDALLCISPISKEIFYELKMIKGETD